MKKIFYFCVLLGAIFLVAKHFKEPIEKALPKDALKESVEKFLPLDSLKDSYEKAISIAHRNWPPSSLLKNWWATVRPAEKTATPLAQETPPATPALIPPPVLELTKVPLTGATESFTTLDGERYTGVVKKVEPSGIILRTADGVSSLKFKNLPAAVGVKYGYDPKLEMAFLKYRHGEEVAAQEKADKYYATPVKTPPPPLLPVASNSISTATNPVTTNTPAVVVHEPPSLVQNGDFLQGASGWSGDGQALGDYLRSHPEARSTNLPSQGLVVVLHTSNWTKVCQRIRGDKNPNYVLRMKYVLSPGISVSSQPEDYLDIIGHTQISEWDGFGKINLTPGHFFDTVKDTSDDKGYYETYAPNFSSTEEQLYEHVVPPLPTTSGKIIAVAFPPGKGFILIKSISVTSH